MDRFLTAQNKYLALYSLSIVVAVLTVVSMYLVAQNQQLSAQIQEVDARTSDISVSENLSLDLSLRVKELEDRIVELEKELGIATEQIKDLSLNWDLPELSPTLRMAEWQVITQEYDGLWPGLSLKVENANCQSPDRPSQYLYSEGGLCQDIFWLSGPNGSIYTKEQLLSLVGKIDSANKAAAWINLTTGNVDRDGLGKALQPKVLFAGGEYYVWVTQSTEFGCGVDLGEPRQYIYQVSANGETDLVAYEEPRKPEQGESVICVD